MKLCAKSVMQLKSVIKNGERCSAAYYQRSCETALRRSLYLHPQFNEPRTVREAQRNASIIHLHACPFDKKTCTSLAYATWTIICHEYQEEHVDKIRRKNGII
jgi:hypothetical protein